MCVCKGGNNDEKRYIFEIGTKKLHEQENKNIANRILNKIRLRFYLI